MEGIRLSVGVFVFSVFLHLNIELCADRAYNG